MNSKPVASKETSYNSLISFPSCAISASLNWTDWTVEAEDCQKTCSNVGGTVQATRQCYSHTVTMDTSECAKHNETTRKVECNEHYCPTSGL